jgi:hypothetical protein
MVVITMLLRASRPEVDINKAATDIHDSVTRWRGTDEAKIFAALLNLSPLAVKALRIQYSASYGDSLDDDLRGDLNEEEMETATQLLQSNRDRAGDREADPAAFSAEQRLVAGRRDLRPGERELDIPVPCG